MSAKTKEERYIIRLYQVALEKGDVHGAINRYEVGCRVGLSEKSVNNILNILARANFVNKLNASDICITAKGLNLVARLGIAVVTEMAAGAAAAAEGDDEYGDGE